MELTASNYYRNAMRKFVYENQGLMKRMYGNQRHYNVLRSEMLNDLYDDMFEEMPRRHHQYRRPPPPQAQQHNTRSARYQKPARPSSLSDKSSGRATSKHQNSHESIPKHHRTSQESHQTHQSNEQEVTESTQQGNVESRSNHETDHPSQVPSNQHRSEHESRAMKLGETAAYSGVRRHHEHVRPRIQFKAPKVRRKLEGPTIITQDPDPSSSSTITTTSTTTATSTTTRRQTTTPTSSSEPGTPTTLEDWTTTESMISFDP